LEKLKKLIINSSLNNIYAKFLPTNNQQMFSYSLSEYVAGAVERDMKKAFAEGKMISESRFSWYDYACSTTKDLIVANATISKNVASGALNIKYLSEPWGYNDQTLVVVCTMTKPLDLS
jgi:hypothetical protein